MCFALPISRDRESFEKSIYRRDVALEAFTHMTKHWSVYPAILKPYADANYAAGANFMIWHTYTASSEELGKP